MLQTGPRRFLELSIAGSGKALYIPTESVLTYEHVPEGKNEMFPDGGSFLRYDYGEGLSFAIVVQPISQLKDEIGTVGFLQLHLIDDAEIFVKNEIVEAVQEVEDEGVESTRLSIRIGGQIGSLFVNDSFETIKTQRA
jgi:hypothetical protein